MPFFTDMHRKGKPMKKSKKTSAIISLTVTAICIALCIVLPMAFHAIPNAGSILSPMHIPVLLCGLTCGPVYGLICGILGPLLSSILTGMPVSAMLPPMMVECAVYGFTSGLLFKIIRTKKIYLNLYISLIGAMLLGRIVAGIARALFFAKGTYAIKIWATSYFVTALPGIILHLIVIPTLVFALMKAKLIPNQIKDE